MAATISKNDARRACAVIFNKLAEPYNETHLAKSVDYFDQASNPVVARLHARVAGVLKGNFYPTDAFGTWWDALVAEEAAREAPSPENTATVISKINSNVNLQVYTSGVWKEIVLDRQQQLDLPDIHEVGRLEEYALPDGWIREPADLYIGPHAINLPGPEAVGVHEEFGVSGASSLRTDGDPVWREPRSRVDITVDTIFAGEKALNEKLRPIVAFLRAAPLTTLQSPVLNTTMLRHLQEEGLFAKLAAAQKNWEANEGRMKEVLTKYGVNDTQTLETLKEQLTTNTDLSRAITALAEVYVPPPSDGTIPGPLQQVPVMFTGLQIQSVNDAVHTYRVRFTFTFMNDLAVTDDGLRYLDKKGRETDSIWDCAWLKRYVEIGWLSDSSRDTYLSEYPIGGRDLSFNYNSEMAPFDVDPVVEDGRDIIVEGVVSGWTNKVVHIPLLGQETPSCQYMGRNSATVELMLNCTLKGIEKITRVKSSIEKNVHSIHKSDRDDRLELVLPIVNLLGYKHFVISRVQTKTEDQMVERYQVLVTLVENRVKIRNRETLVLNNQTLTKKLAKSLWDHIWETYTGFWENSLPRERRLEFDYVRTLLFGTDKSPLEGCLVNSDVLRAFTWASEDLYKFLAEYYIEIEGRDAVGSGKPRYYVGDTRARTSGVDIAGITNHGRPMPDMSEWLEVRMDGRGQANFYWAWRHIMATQEVTEGVVGIGEEKYRRRMCNQFRDGGARPTKRMRDDLFQAIWDRADPADWTQFDRAHRTWAAKRERYIKSAFKEDESFDSLPDTEIAGLPNPLKTARKLRQEEDVAERQRNWDKWYPRSDIDESPGLWSKGRVNDSFRTLYMIALNMPDLLPNWTVDGKDPAQYINQNAGIPVNSYDPTTRARDLRSLSCYPDFVLPTYRDLFTFGGGLNAVWVHFAPTAAQMGIPRGDHGDILTFDTSEPLAVGVDDLVQPTFYFSTGRYKRNARRAEAELLSDEVINEAVKSQTFLKVDLTRDAVVERYKNEVTPDHLHKLIDGLLSDKAENKYKNDRARTIFKKLDEGLIEEVVLQTSDDFVMGVARPAKDDTTGKKYEITMREGVGRSISFIDNSADFNLNNPKVIREALQDTLDRIPEDKQDVKRCFPTFRFRIIDFDSGMYTDEFYEYNAVRSIHIYHDKYDASTCQMEIMNLTGVLDEDTFFTDEEARDIGLPGEDEKVSKFDKRAGRYLRTIKLREGTSIQILMGYDPDPDRLETVFTGRISQVQMGDVVQIVAQGYKTELLNEVSLHAKKQPFSSILRSVFQHLDGEGHVEDRTEVLLDERKNGTPHLGSRIDLANDQQMQEYDRVMRALFGEDTLVYGSGNWKWAGAYGRRVSSFGLDHDEPMLRVDGRSYIDLFSAKPSRMRNVYMKNFTSNKIDKWTVSFQPAIDAIMEMTSFMPGWVCDVVPYDHLATLYVGPPDGQYFWTSRLNRDTIAQLRRPQAIRQETADQRIRIVELMTRFANYALPWIRDKRVKGREGLSRREIISREGRVQETWLPEEWQTSNLEGPINDIRRTNERVFRAMIGAFFGFDLITKNDFPPEIASTMWYIVRRATGWDGNVFSSGAIRADFWGDSNDEILWHTKESLQRGVEEIVKSAPGFQQRLLTLSQFDDPEIQRVVGELTFLLLDGSAARTVELDRLDGVTVLERLQALTPNVNASRISEQDLVEIQGLDDDFFTSNEFLIPIAPPRHLMSNFGFYVADRIKEFRTYLYLMWSFLENLEDEDIQTFAEDLIDIESAFAKPDRRVFRQYHHVTSRYDIIENNIVASTKEMANSILLRYADGPQDLTEVASAEGRDQPPTFFLDEGDINWTVFKHPDGIPFHPNIRLEQKKLAITVEKNVTNEQEAASVFFNRMGEALRPMYRGNLVIWGRVMKPHDVVFLYDQYNEMTGPVEVERCIHHFTPEGGWTTTIVPHAFVHVDNAVDIFQTTVLEKTLGLLNTSLTVANWATLALSIISFGTLAGVGKAATILGGLGRRALNVAIKKTVRKRLRKKITAQVWRGMGSLERGVRGAQRLATLGGQSAGKEAATALIKREGIHSIAKEAGSRLAPWVKTGLWSTAFLGGSVAANAMIHGYSTSLVTFGNEKLQGVVSITPLLFEGRPLVAGLDLDDDLYLSKFDNFWQHIKDKVNGATEYIANTAEGLFSEDVEATNDEFGAIGPHKGVK